MARFSKEKEMRIRRNLEQAFEAVKELMRHPEQIEAMPNGSVIVPVGVRAKRKK